MPHAFEHGHVLRSLCGACAARMGGVLGDMPIMYGTACEEHPTESPPAATGFYVVPLPAATPIAPRPRLELVKVPKPDTLDATTHARQALALVGSWTHARAGEGALEADETMCELAVAAVARVHELVKGWK